jgi:hypothetical protein
MPYIKQKDRERFLIKPKEISNPYLDVLGYTGMQCGNPGDLNYAITTICHAYLQNNGENYQHYNDIIGALEGVKLELYRRHTAPYEDLKIAENGDV